MKELGREGPKGSREVHERPGAREGRRETNKRMDGDGGKCALSEGWHEGGIELWKEADERDERGEGGREGGGGGERLWLRA